MQGAQLLLDGGEGRIHLGLARHVADEQGAATIPAAHFRLGHFQIGAVDVDQGQHGTLTGQTQGDGATEPTPGPGNGNDSVMNVHECS
ncbi:hypothetical protein D3C76_1445930 [compost metagenome]